MTPKERAANYMRLKDGYKNKEEQKQNLIDMMQDDEKLGLYDDKSLTEIEYLEYMSKKAKTVHTIIYPDGSKGELNRGVVVLL